MWRRKCVPARQLPWRSSRKLGRGHATWQVPPRSLGVSGRSRLNRRYDWSSLFDASQFPGDRGSQAPKASKRVSAVPWEEETSGVGSQRTQVLSSHCSLLGKVQQNRCQHLAHAYLEVGLIYESRSELLPCNLPTNPTRTLHICRTSEDDAVGRRQGSGRQTQRVSTGD